MGNYCTAGEATDDITLRMRLACWIPKATNPHSLCVMLSAFSTATMVVRTRFSFALYVHCLSCLNVTILEINCGYKVFLFEDCIHKKDI